MSYREERSGVYLDRKLTALAIIHATGINPFRCLLSPDKPVNIAGNVSALRHRGCRQKGIDLSALVPFICQFLSAEGYLSCGRGRGNLIVGDQPGLSGDSPHSIQSASPATLMPSANGLKMLVLYGRNPNEVDGAGRPCVEVRSALKKL